MNPAQRLLEVFDKLVLVSNKGMSAGGAWVQALGIDESDADTRDDVVVECLQSLRAELSAARQALLAQGVPEELLQPCWARFADIASPAAMRGDWNSLRGNLTPPEVRLSLAWAAWAMRAEEAAIDEAALKALLAEVESLEATANQAGVSPFMRLLALRQASVLRKAYRMYGVRGVAAMQDAIESVAGLAVTHADLAEADAQAGTPETRAAWDKTKAVFAKFVNIARTATKGAEGLNKGLETGKRLLENGQALYDKVAPLWDTLQKLPPPG